MVNVFSDPVISIPATRTKVYALKLTMAIIVSYTEFYQYGPNKAKTNLENKSISATFINHFFCIT